MTTKLTDSAALDAIRRALLETAFSPDTLDKVRAIVAATGRNVSKYGVTR